MIERSRRREKSMSTLLCSPHVGLVVIMAQREAPRQRRSGVATMVVGMPSTWSTWRRTATAGSPARRWSRGSEQRGLRLQRRLMLRTTPPCPRPAPARRRPRRRPGEVIRRGRDQPHGPLGLRSPRPPPPAQAAWRQPAHIQISRTDQHAERSAHAEREEEKGGERGWYVGPTCQGHVNTRQCAT